MHWSTRNSSSRKGRDQHSHHKTSGISCNIRSGTFGGRCNRDPITEIHIGIEVMPISVRALMVLGNGDGASSVLIPLGDMQGYGEMRQIFINTAKFHKHQYIISSIEWSKTLDKVLRIDHAPCPMMNIDQSYC